MNRVSKQQTVEWADNPVTLKLLDLCKTELSDIQETSITDCLIAGNPHKSHENLVELEARERVWESWVAVLSGDWDYFEEEDEDE